MTKVSRTVLLFVLGLSAAPGAAWALGVSNPNIDTPLNANVDMTYLPMHPLAYPEPPTSQAAQKLEITTSAWMPGNFVVNSFVPGTSAFQTTGMPSFGVGLLTHLPWLTSGNDFYLKLGTNFTFLQRSGTATFSGGPSLQTQDAFLLPFEAGIEWSPHFAQFKYISFYTEAAALPTILITQQSVFDNGTIGWGIPGKLSLGASSSLSWLAKSLSDLELTGEVLGTFGSVDGGNFLGAGVAGGLRLNL